MKSIWTKMLNYDKLEFGDSMNIWDGNKNDTTNFEVDSFLKINSCGFQNIKTSSTIVRKEGRYDYHFLLINKGECEALYDGKEYVLTSGNLLVYAPKEAQQYTFKPDTTSLWCHFGGSAVSEVFEDLKIKSGVYFLNPDKKIYETFLETIARFHQRGFEKYATASLLELFYSVADGIFKENQNGKADIILPIITFINVNYNKNITVEQLAELSGYSKSRFSHIFSEVMGTTPIQYQNEIRLKSSKEMLLSTNLTVSEIAISCGFSDPLYYSRLFKKKYGIPPTEYRKTE